MKNLFLLPMEKPSRLLYNSKHESFCVQKELGGMYFNDGKVSSADFWGIEKAMNNGFNPVNFYVTSYEEIIEGNNEWYLDRVLNEPYNSGGAQYASKQDVIIMTTDTELIADGVQKIDDEFLEWFVKNPSCEEFEVHKICYGALSGFADAGYKIIIPKEETDYTALLQPVGTTQETIEQFKKKSMKKERTIKQLLELMLEHQDLFVTGLCHWVMNLKYKDLITFEENLLLDNFIADNRPNKYSSFSAYKNRNLNYYWQSSNIKPRIKWLKKHISRL